MTDNEIVKALECRVKDKCPECPYFHGYPCDKCRNMQTDALDLINRLQAENEKIEANYNSLKAQEEKSHQYCKNVCEPKYKAEIERLKDLNNLLTEAGQEWENQYKNAKADIGFLRNELSNCEFLKKELEIDIRNAKAEAYKECIEKVKEELAEWVGADNSINYFRIKKVCDNLLKELIGE